MPNMEQLKHFFNDRDRYAVHNGIRVVEVSPGKAVTRMKVEEQHLNGVGTVQGGAVFTLADLAFAAAVNSHGTVAVAINVSITFIKAAAAGTLYAHAVETTKNPKLATCDIRVVNEEDELIATFQGLAYRKKESLPL